MTSLLSAAPPSATVDGSVDGVMLMHSDVNPPGAVCTYTSSKSYFVSQAAGQPLIQAKLL